MRCFEEVRERYLRDGISRRLLALAANLARIGSFSKDPRNLSAVKDLVKESEHFIEWTVADLPLDWQARLIDLQIRLARYLCRLDGDMREMDPFLQDFKTESEQLIAAFGMAV